MLEIADSMIENHKVKPLTDLKRKHFLEIAKVHASEAHRIIALAYKDLPVKVQYTV